MCLFTWTQQMCGWLPRISWFVSLVTRRISEKPRSLVSTEGKPLFAGPEDVHDRCSPGERSPTPGIDKRARFCPDELRPGPRCRRRLRQISETVVRVDLFAADPARLSHDGERLHRSHAAASLPRRLELRSRQPVVSLGESGAELQPVGVLLLQPDRARPVRPRMGLQPGDGREHHGDRGTRDNTWKKTNISSI